MKDLEDTIKTTVQSAVQAQAKVALIEGLGGVDRLADKMLDAFNRYRETGDPGTLETARKYAALLKLDGAGWPALSGEPAKDKPEAYF